MKKTVTLPFEKETPGTVRYGAEIAGRPVSFYVPKSWLGSERPTFITVTVDGGDPAAQQFLNGEPGLLVESGRAEVA